MNEKQYEIVKPDNAPIWFQSGIMCEVWDLDKECSTIATIIWFDEREYKPFISDDGDNWKHAKPIEKWIPKENEAVAYWDNGKDFFCVAPYKDSAVKYYDNIAKYDGQLDLRIETLKDAPRYK